MSESTRPLWVQKYGGTSVGSPERILAVARRIAHARTAGRSLVIVVSAMGHATDELIELAHQVSAQPPHREMDMLLTTGERVSMALLSMALADLGVPAISLTGSQSGIITDGAHRRARIRRILGDRIRAGLADGKVVIVAGFQGVSEQKEITTLGRGGSDTTAVALAAALRAERCEIYTDVDGVYSADPRIVPHAKRWDELSAEVMVELATRGAGVLHPRSVQLAESSGVTLVVRNSFDTDFDSQKGTRIMSKATEVRGPSVSEEFEVKGVTADQDKFLITVELARASVTQAIWDRAAQAHLQIVAPMFSGTAVRFFTDREGEAEWKRLLGELARDGFVASYRLETDQIPLSVVGARFSQDGAALAQVLDVLAREHVSVSGGSASALAITVAIPKTHVAEGTKALHRAFVEGDS